MADVDAKTRESAFEKEFVEHLGSCGWLEGSPSEYDPDTALYPRDLLGYIKDTQKEQWNKLNAWHNGDAENNLLKRIAGKLDKQGSLHVLRHGIKDVMARFQICQFQPSHGFNPEVVDRYRKNRLRVVRQVQYTRDSAKALDLVFFINGIPVATAELKTDLKQNVQDAIRQYKKDRKPKDSQNKIIPLLAFKKRALVHFAVSTTEVYMTTRLDGDNTEFLPFNQGHAMGAGNPPREDSYPVAYLWEDVLQPSNWLDIVGKFLHLETKDKEDSYGKEYREERLIFPRYHQWDCVRKLIGTAKEEGPGHSYLIQHSAGSGKSNSISWTSHRLAGLHDDQDNKIFDSVIVISDRRVLDTQLQEAIYQFEHKHGVVEKIDQDSNQLARALQHHVPIIVTTLQKFPVVLERIGQWENVQAEKIGGGRYAVIVDEAHSSQSGMSAQKLKHVLDGNLDLMEKEDITAEEFLNSVLEKRSPSGNISYFAFTATPKGKTIELFGKTPKGGDKPEPFHVYSMQQAIEEGFILDVLKNYVTYKAFFKLAQEGEKQEDDEVDVSKAKKSIARYIKLHPYNISQKVAIIVEHFRDKIMHRLKGRARAMVVTSSRQEAVRYKVAMDKYLDDNNYANLKTLVAFSGELNDPETSIDTLTEYNMNPELKGRSLEKAFEDEFQIMLVADKFQTGFDQPLLCAMYVDKRLSGVAAVQTLSRLNRIYPGKNETFVLDFVNEADDILEAFKPYYRDAQLSFTTDPNIVNDLMDKLDEKGVYTDSEVEQFAKVYFDPRQDISQGKLIGYLKPAKDRFEDLELEEQKMFLKDLKSFVRSYDFLSFIVPFADEELEKKTAYARHLQSFLKVKEPDDYISLENVYLSHYRIEKTAEHKNLNPYPEAGEDVNLNPPSELGTGSVYEPKKDYMSNIIEQLNELFAGDHISENDRITFFQNILGNVTENENIADQARNNTFDQFKSGDINNEVMNAVVQGLNSYGDMAKEVLENEETWKVFSDLLAKAVYERFQNYNV